MELLLGADSTSSEVRAVPQPSRLPWILAGILAIAFGAALWAPWRTENQVDRPLARLDVDLGEDVFLLPPRPSITPLSILRD